MKIIQSYSHIKTNGSYSYDYKHGKNFYTFLLSYLTIKKYYGSVKMFCDKEGYEKLIKYIPYDEVEIFENKFKNNSLFWSNYKVTIMLNMKEPFIHTDSDVFIFDEIFKDFINKDYDIIVQDNSYGIKNGVYPYFVNNFYENNMDILIRNNMIKNKSKKGFVSCGVVGFKSMDALEHYSLFYNKMISLYNSNIIKNVENIAAVSEELTLYLTILDGNFKLNSILDNNIIKKDGLQKAAVNAKYTHLWLLTKYEDKYLSLVKNKLKKDFPGYIRYVEKYEKSQIKNELSLLKM